MKKKSLMMVCGLLLLRILTAQTVGNGFYFPSEIVIDSKGNLYITGKNNKIIQISPDGKPYDFAGSPRGAATLKDGKGTGACFNATRGMAIDANDNIYLADYNTIRKITPDAVVTTIYGNNNKSTVVDGDRNTASFHRPECIAVDGNGLLYVTDEIFDSAEQRTYNIIRKISQQGLVTTIKNDDGTLFKAAWIYGLACDKDLNLYLSAVDWSSCIMRITPDGKITTVAGRYDHKHRVPFKEGDVNTARFTVTQGIAIDKNGDIYFSDSWEHRIVRVADNKAMVIAGAPGGGSSDGKAKQASFINPHGIAFDKSGNLFIVDAGNSCVRKLTPDGIVTTFCKPYFDNKTARYVDPPSEQRETVNTNIKTAPGETDLMLEKLQRQIDSAMNDPRNRISRGTNGTNSSNNSYSNAKTNTIVAKKFPARKTALLTALPKKNLSKQELTSFLTLLYSDLKKKLPSAKVAAAEAIISKLNKDASDVSAAAVVGWYKNAPAEAALLITYAASQAPDDITLNNCGAILNMCGLEQKAIPVLKYALVNEPNNSTLLNNVGQAYAGLGATDSARVYLMACIKQCDTHPQACATAAYIESKRGNTDQAVKYIEQAIKGGGFTDDLFDFYKSIKRDAKLEPLLEKNLSDKKYFELNGFEIAPNCTNWQDCETVYAKQQAFKKKIDEISKQFEDIIKQYSPTNVRSAKEFLTWSSDKNWDKGPLAPVAFALRSELYSAYNEKKMEAMFKFADDYSKLGTEEELPERRAFDNKYAELFRDAKGDRIRQLLEQQCRERVTIDNKYFDKRTRLAEKFKNDWIAQDMKVYDDLLFLTVLISPNENIFKSESAVLGAWLIHQFSVYSVVTCSPGSKPDCAQYDPKKDFNVNSPGFSVAKCPINIEAPFGIGKINLDCTSFKIEAGEGIIFNYEKNFITRESTIAVGAGISAHVPGIKPIELGAKEQLFIKFDKNNQPCDLGASWEAEIDIKGVNNPEIKTGYTVGINSGWNFEPGALKVLFPSL